MGKYTIPRCVICAARASHIGLNREDLCERHAFEEARKTVSDFALMLRHFADGSLRWEEFPASIRREGELCFDGLRHFTHLDRDGIPILTADLRARLLAAGKGAACRS